jgi:hypothetical protein
LVAFPGQCHLAWESAFVLVLAVRTRPSLHEAPRRVSGGQRYAIQERRPVGQDKGHRLLTVGAVNGQRYVFPFGLEAIEPLGRAVRHVRDYSSGQWTRIFPTAT